jgi:predicted PurR-regulated permease PerM
LLLIGLGFGGVALTQNVVKPKLLGDRAGLHPGLVLLSTIGGIAWLGLIGFLVGPLLAALFIIVWEQFAKRYSQALSTKH